MTHPIVTRFAPSPTGYLHVGGARTALFNWLLARHEGAGARYLLRIEDTDLARSTQQACDQLLEDLRWLGLHWGNADGMPTYHFAVVVDDAEMNVTHVLRGQEHTKNTFLHIALQEALGYPRPAYAHLSTIMNPDNTKMGKRDRDKKVREGSHNYLK